MAFTEQEEQALRTRALLIDTGDGLGTFTVEEIALLKEVLEITLREKLSTLANAAVALGIAEPETPTRWIPPCTAAPTPDWQPADITAETLTPVAGQGAKL